MLRFSAKILALGAWVAAAASGCALEVVDPADVNLEVVVLGTPPGTESISVRVQAGADVLERHPPPSDEVRVLLRDVPHGNVDVRVEARDAAGDLLAHGQATGGAGAARSELLVTLAALSPCPEFDAPGASCPIRTLPLPFAAGRLLPLAGDTMLVVKPGAHIADDFVWLLHPGDMKQISGGALPEAFVRRADGAVALLFVDAAPDGTGRLVAAHGGETPSYLTVRTRIRPGSFGFLGPHVWALENEDDTGAGALAVVDAATGSPASPFAACTSGRVRGPLAASLDGATLLFEQDDASAPLLRVHADGRCEPALTASASFGTLSRAPNGELFAYRERLTGDLVVSNGARYTPPSDALGPVAIADDGTVYAALDGQVWRFDAETPLGRKLTGDFDLVRLQFGPGPGAAFVGQDADGFLVFIKPEGRVTLIRSPRRIDWRSLRWTGPNVLVVWEPGAPGAAVPGWRFDLKKDPPDRPWLEGRAGDVREWPSADGPRSVVGAIGGLFDSATGKRLVGARERMAFDTSPEGLVYVDAVDERPRLLRTPDEAAHHVLPHGAYSIAWDPGAPGRLWVAFKNGWLAQLESPRSTP